MTYIDIGVKTWMCQGTRRIIGCIRVEIGIMHTADIHCGISSRLVSCNVCNIQYTTCGAILWSNKIKSKECQ